MLDILRPGFVKTASVASLMMAMATACTSLESGSVDAGVPTSDEVRSFFGLFPGSGWRFRRPDGTTALVSIEGPNTTNIPGHEVYLQKVRPRANDTLEQVWYYDVTSAGSLGLRRLTEIVTENSESRLVTRRFESDPIPNVATLSYDSAGEPALEDGLRFETQVSPTVCDSVCSEGAVETYRWSVLKHEELVPPAGFEAFAQPGIKLQFDRSGGGSSSVSSISEFVPGFGLVSFTDFDGVDYLICAAYVCSAEGECTGDPDLACSS